MKLANDAESESARVRALELLGKELGLFADRTDHTFRFKKPAEMSEDELREWIAWLEPIAAAEPLTIETTAEPEPV
jgi:hypothetical protein